MICRSVSHLSPFFLPVAPLFLFFSMQIIPRLLAVQDPCIGPNDCPEPEPCNCASDQECIIINRQVRSDLPGLSLIFSFFRDCHTCSQTTCVDSGSSKSGGGVSKGALAGGIVGAVLFLALSVSLFMWYRRKFGHRKTKTRVREPQRDKPARAADVLNRPDPTEKLTISSSQQSATIGITDPESHGTTLPPPSRPHLTNPFDDSNSIETTKTEGPNVIPIALESSGSRSDTDAHSSTQLSADSSGPLRPPRSPDLNLNLEHVNVSNDNFRQLYATSTISGISALSTNSYMSGASYSSDFLNEAPVIVTANKSPVHQVLNALRAEVVPAGSVPSSPDSSLKTPLFASRPAITSPLAATSFGPNDVLKEADEDEVADPFEDNRLMTAPGNASPIATRSDPISPKPDSTKSVWIPDDPTAISSTRSDDSRPSSISTQTGSVANIGSVTRLDVGLGGLASPSTQHRGVYRTAMGRLVSPLSGGSLQPGPLQEQQARAYAQAQGSRRISGSSIISAASTRADSILEAFPFVPPSPISDRPIRSPVSPLANSVISTSSPPQLPTRMSAQSSPPPTVTVAPASPLSQRDFKANDTSTVSSDDEALPAPPNRHTLGMSTGSQLSTTSTGLGQFPFQIDTGSNSDVSSSASRPTTLSVRHRASLDTLALTSDLTTYSLDFVPLLPRQPQTP